MQYTYNIVEAAALWAGVAPAEIRARMESADQTKLEAAYAQALEKNAKYDADDKIVWEESRTICEFHCDQASTCPQWKEVMTEDGDWRSALQCPEGFSSKPGDNPPEPREVIKPSPQRRPLPLPGEFADLPEFERRLGWLTEALSRGDLPGPPEAIRAHDLRNWVQQHFLGEQPNFLFAQAARAEESPVDGNDRLSNIVSETGIGTQEESGLGHREQLIRAIVAMIDNLKLDRKCVPLGMKGKILINCKEARPDLFGGGDDPFLKAWSAASKAGRISIENKHKFKKR